MAAIAAVSLTSAAVVCWIRRKRRLQGAQRVRKTRLDFAAHDFSHEQQTSAVLLNRGEGKLEAAAVLGEREADETFYSSDHKSAKKPTIENENDNENEGENEYIRKRNALLRRKASELRNQTKMLTSEADASLCAICLESLQKKRSASFDCLRHFGHVDCVDFYYADAENGHKCPYRCG